MSIINLMQRIREVSKALQAAKDAQDWDAVDSFEDELYNLEQELEEAENSDNKYDWI